ncbi:YjbQ family protein [candidate division KSB1 bacterium]|nr:YjbQ family protein [candidate division KSB1 bacterium]
MKVITETIPVSTKGNADIIDITGQARERLDKSGLSDGMVHFFVSGSTAAITTTEYEPGLIEDLPEALERIAPSGSDYHHDATWGDGNGHSHVRASFLGPGLGVPFANGRMALGTWQQIIVIDMDNRSRKREIIMQMMGI